MSDRETGRDALDAQVAAKLRQLRMARPLPEPGEGDPSDDELLRYIDGAATGSERAALEERIAKSPYAAALVGVVVEALRDCGYPAPKVEPVGRRVARYVFRYAQDAFTFLRGSDMPAALAPALAVRGAAVARQDAFYEFTHAFDGIEAKIAIERVEGRGFEIQLALSEGGQPVEGARVLLRRDGTQVDSAATEGGACRFDALEAARYQLEVRRAGAEIGTIHLDVLAP